jgi:hypothetical protein
MATSTPVKTVQTALLAWQDVATANVQVGTALDVSNYWEATVFARLGRRSGTAFTAGWPNIRIEVSEATSGNDGWYPTAAVFQPPVGASIANTTLNGAVSAGATSFVVTAATNIAVGDILYLGDSSSANWELVRVKTVSGTTITPEEAVTFAHANGSAVTDQAEIFTPAVLGLSSIKRIRAVADNASGGQTCAVKVSITTFDNITTA